jgi:DNA-binding MarR family transcriptional regulator
MKMPAESAIGARFAASPPKKPASAVAPWHGELTATARRFYQVCLANVSEAVADGGLTSLQFGALLYLSKQPDVQGVEQSRLAAGLDVDRNSASLLVEHLVTKGLVERRVNAADRRARLLKLTPKGEKLRLRLRPVQLAANERVLSALAPRERKALFDLMNRVIAANRADATADAGERIGARPPPSAGA